MEKRYTALRIIATLYKIIGVIIAILTVLGVIFTLVAQPVIDFGLGIRVFNLVSSIFGAVVVLIGGGLSAIGVYAVGELIFLLINIEENTRFTALIIRDRMQPPQPVRPMPQPPYQAPAQPPYQAPVQQPYQPPEPPPQEPPAQEPPDQPPQG